MRGWTLEIFSSEAATAARTSACLSDWVAAKEGRHADRTRVAPSAARVWWSFMGVLSECSVTAPQCTPALRFQMARRCRRLRAALGAARVRVLLPMRCRHRHAVAQGDQAKRKDDQNAEGHGLRVREPVLEAAQERERA